MHRTTVAGQDRGIVPDPEFALPRVLDCMPVGIGVYDGAGVLTRANARFFALAPARLDRLTDMTPPTWSAFDAEGAPIDPADFPGVAAAAGRMATPGHEFQCRDADGAMRWLNVSAVPLTTPEQPQPIGVVLVLEDIAERKRADARLAEVEDRFRQFAHNSHCALWVADAESGDFSFLNPASFRLWPSVDSDETLGQLLGRVHPDDRTAVQRQREQVAEGHGQTLTYRMVDAAGAVVRHLRETSFPMPPRPGGRRSVAGIVENVAPDLPLYLVGASDSDQQSLIAPLERAGYRVKAFRTPEDLLAILDVLSPGCVLLRIADAQHDAAALVRSIKARCILPVVLIGAAALPPAAVKAALEAGASSCVPGLFEGEGLETALAGARAALPRAGEQQPAQAVEQPSPVEQLSARERQVLVGLMEGGTNKSIARTLGLSPRTVEVHRARLMDRLNVRTLPELVRVGLAAGAG